MNRNLTFVVCSLLASLLLWRQYDARSNAAEARSGETAENEAKEAKSQGLDKTSAGTKVALLDLGAVFKVHRGFSERTAVMKKDVEGAEEQIKVRQNAIKSMSDKLEALAKTSDDYRSLSEEIGRVTNELKTEVGQQKKEFMQREAQIYAEVYDDVMGHVKKYAAAHQIELVMRFNNSEMDRSDPQEVIRELNKSVLFQSGIDITADIIALVNGL